MKMEVELLINKLPVFKTPKIIHNFYFDFILFFFLIVIESQQRK